MNEKKVCSKCKEPQLLTDFYKDLKSKDGRSRYCIFCQRKASIAWAKENPVLHNNRGKNWKKNNPDKVRNCALVYNFKITLQDYNFLLSIQNGVCALCRRRPFGRTLAVDHLHDHHENKTRGCKECIRGLLCNNCNRKILPTIEVNEHLQSDFIKQYLLSRPLMQK